MQQLLFVPLVLMGLMVSNTASAAMVDLYDGFYGIYDPNNTYGGEIELIEGDIYTFGFDFIADGHEFVLTIDLQTDFVGVLDWGVTPGPNATGQSFGGGSLTAGQSVDVSIKGGFLSSPQNPTPLHISLLLSGSDSGEYNFPVTSSVPLPASVWLFGSGLLGLTMIRRRKVDSNQV